MTIASIYIYYKNNLFINLNDNNSTLEEFQQTGYFISSASNTQISVIIIIDSIDLKNKARHILNIVTRILISGRSLIVSKFLIIKELDYIKSSFILYSIKNKAVSRCLFHFYLIFVF